MEAKKDVLLHREAEMNKLIEEVKKLTPLQKNKLFTDIVAKHGKSFPRAKVTLPKGVTLKKKVRGLKTIKGTTDDLVFEIKQGNSITESVETVFRSQQEDIKQKIKKYM